ncbi:MAG: serine--tRNA ligase [bacterium]
MLSIHFIRENPDIVRKTIADKRLDLDLDALLALDREVVDLKQQVEALAAEVNRLSKSFGTVSKDERPALIARSRELGAQKKDLQDTLREREEALADLMWRTPGIPADDVPLGVDDADNVEIRRKGEPTAFDFEIRDHVDLIGLNDWGELDRVTDVAGSRTYALKGELARLEIAVHLFVLDKLTARGFTMITVPALAREDAFYGTGHFPGGKEDAYKLPADDLYLSGTAEIILTSLHRGEILDEERLPILYAGYSPCFRREAGSFGRDVRGLMRVHQFTKVEQYVICKDDPAESAKWHNELLTAAEEVVADLELPYRVVECCTGEMGLGKHRMHDIEVWVPSLSTYRETHSCSSLHDWQARRADLRYRARDDQKVHHVHTLNNTGVATPRLLVALLENHQQADGSVRLPEKLWPYMMGKTAIGAR